MEPQISSLKPYFNIKPLKADCNLVEMKEI